LYRQPAKGLILDTEHITFEQPVTQPFALTVNDRDRSVTGGHEIQWRYPSAVTYHTI